MIYSDPWLSDPDSGDYELSYRSPCIDNGTPANTSPLDLNGNPRPVGYGVDIGAYEYQTALGTGAHLFMNDTDLTAGDHFILDFLAVGTDREQSVDIVVALQIGDAFYFYPQWNQTFHVENIWLRYSRDWKRIFDFIWPECDGSYAGLCFWGAVLDPEKQSLIGDIATIAWSYH